MNQQSTASIVREEAVKLGLRTRELEQQWMVSDQAECQETAVIQERCAECVYRRHPGSGETILTSSRTGLEVGFCSYSESASKLEESLWDTYKFEDLLRSGVFRVTYQNGFDYISHEPYPSSDTEEVTI